MGMCVAGGAYLPVMTDTVLMTEGSGLFLAGPSLVQAAIGQKTDPEELGGAAMHAEISGTVDFKEPNDHLCLARLRSLVDKMGERHAASAGEVFRRRRLRPRARCAEIRRRRCVRPAQSRARREQRLRHARGDRAHRRPQRVRRVQGGVRPHGAVRLCVDRRPRRGHRRQPEDQPEPDRRHGPGGRRMRIEVGGVIYTEGAQKAARFIMDCNQNLVPLMFLHDVNGFMVGKDAEWSGIIRAGAKMVSAVSTSVVPKIAVIVGGSFGAGHYAMCGKAYDPRFLFAWPTARYAVMSGASAANTLAEVRARQMERGGKVLSEAEKTAISRRDSRRLRCAGRSALRRGAPVDRRDHRSGEDERGADRGAGSLRAESRCPALQSRSPADLIISARRSATGCIVACADGILA